MKEAMAKDKQKNAENSDKAINERRLAEALRANLKKRKVQQRQRQEPPKPQNS